MPLDLLGCNSRQAQCISSVSQLIRRVPGRHRRRGNLVMELGERANGFRFLIRDRDGKFGREFDEALAGADVHALKIPPRSPRANVFAERFVGTLRRECLDHLLVLGERHLRQVLAEYERHYNGHRPHQALSLRQPLHDPAKVRSHGSNIDEAPSAA
ncbi:transposase [Nonomuraea angiospora]|uniref:integrase core domain-containing protein n=1 Tax=Nonomuraea angiospora TaxID=46172 RepID=UPI003332B872